MILCVMAVYAAITTSPHCWKFNEAQHFVSVLGMSFEEYDSAVGLLGAKRVEERLLQGLHRKKARCPTSRTPESFLAAWKQFLVFRRTPARAKVHLRSEPAVEPPAGRLPWLR